MLISRRGYNWNNVLSPTGGPINGCAYISGRAYNRDFTCLRYSKEILHGSFVYF